jgi:hypothetical protein
MECARQLKEHIYKKLAQSMDERIDKNWRFNGNCLKPSLVMRAF